jgi:hypothetical protein
MSGDSSRPRLRRHRGGTPLVRATGTPLVRATGTTIAGG